MSEKEVKKKRFVVKQHFDESAGIHRKDVFIDDQLFEYEIDQESLRKAKEMGPKFYLMACQDIQTHFLQCLSEFMGREVTQEEVMTATRTGWI
jgi:ornithine carbamoyltransferase